MASGIVPAAEDFAPIEPPPAAFFPDRDRAASCGPLRSTLATAESGCSARADRALLTNVLLRERSSSFTALSALVTIDGRAGGRPCAQRRPRGDAISIQ